MPARKPDVVFNGKSAWIKSENPNGTVTLQDDKGRYLGTIASKHLANTKSTLSLEDLTLPEGESSSSLSAVDYLKSVEEAGAVVAENSTKSSNEAWEAQRAQQAAEKAVAAEYSKLGLEAQERMGGIPAAIRLDELLTRDVFGTNEDYERDYTEAEKTEALDNLLNLLAVVDKSHRSGEAAFSNETVVAAANIRKSLFDENNLDANGLPKLPIYRSSAYDGSPQLKEKYNTPENRKKAEHVGGELPEEYYVHDVPEAIFSFAYNAKNDALSYGDFRKEYNALIYNGTGKNSLEVERRPKPQGLFQRLFRS